MIISFFDVETKINLNQQVHLNDYKYCDSEKIDIDIDTQTHPLFKKGGVYVNGQTTEHPVCGCGCVFVHARSNVQCSCTI